MADNTLQFRWIATLKGNLDVLLGSRAFVAGDLLWYPVEGEPRICQAPDVLVAFGRARGDRGSYRQWDEDGVAPQVVFEVLSPGNTLAEMERKRVFYELYQVEEYYLLDPARRDGAGYARRAGRLDLVTDLDELGGSPRGEGGSPRGEAASARGEAARARG